jgi:putative transposase
VPLVAAVRVAQRWSMDFMRDTLSDRRKFRTFNLFDDFTRENAAIESDTSLPDQKVVERRGGGAICAAHSRKS